MRDIARLRITVGGDTQEARLVEVAGELRILLGDHEAGGRADSFRLFSINVDGNVYGCSVEVKEP